MIVLVDHIAGNFFKLLYAHDHLGTTLWQPFGKPFKKTVNFYDNLTCTGLVYTMVTVEDDISLFA